jgi:hypothetical protein
MSTWYMHVAILNTRSPGWNVNKHSHIGSPYMGVTRVYCTEINIAIIKMCIHDTGSPQPHVSIVIRAFFIVEDLIVCPPDPFPLAVVHVATACRVVC